MGRVIEELLLLDKEGCFFELNRLHEQLHTFALGLEGLVVNGHSVRPYCKPDRKEDMQALCKTCWQLVGKLRGLVQAWGQADCAVLEGQAERIDFLAG